MSDLRIASLEPERGFLRVCFAPPAAGTADFHWFWLRHNCECCRHPQTGERTLCASEVPLSIEPAGLTIAANGDAVEIRWAEPAGPHLSVFRADWLREHAYAADRERIAPPASHVAALEIDHLRLAADASLAETCAERVRRLGAAVVRNAGEDTEQLIDLFATLGWSVIGTHFGRIEDLRTDNTTNRNTDQLGYTDSPVGLHTDQPFIDQPPRLQMLHCMRPATRGGENYIVDAHQAARHLRSLDAHAFHVLTSVPVRFHRVQKAFESLKTVPIIELRDGEIFCVRSSYFTLAPHRVPFAEMEELYRAYQRFVAMTNDPDHQYRFALDAGDFLLYDNFRMLHARTGFEGPRWVRGVYFDPADGRA